MAESELPQRIILMGVSGTGKSSVGKALAPHIDAVYKDGDAYHTESNIKKMNEGTPLTDDDRWPWLEKVGEALTNSEGRVIIGCSSLKRAYRDAIRGAAGHDVVFVHLTGTRELITERMKHRSGHFMPASLLDSQMADLEPPTDDENSIAIDIEPPVEEIAKAVCQKLKTRQPVISR